VEFYGNFTGWWGHQPGQPAVAGISNLSAMAGVSNLSAVAGVPTDHKLNIEAIIWNNPASGICWKLY
jgi:hypothetical protein